MRRHKWIPEMAACLTAATVAFAAPAANLVIPGSGNPEYVLGALAAEFNSRQSTHRVVVPRSTGTAGAIRDVSEGKAILGRVGRPLRDQERSAGLAYIPLARDAVVFVAGAGVSPRSVTPGQMIDAFTGKVKDWREIGGGTGPIRAVGREITDASRQALAAKITAFQTILWAESVKIVHLDPQMIELLDRYETSLGFLNRSALYAAKTKVVPLALNGVEPTPDNLASGRYTVWLELGLIHKSRALTGEALSFVNFVKSPAGERILRAHGVLPLKTGA